MRRVVVALAATIAVVVAVLLYRSPPVRTTSAAAPNPTPSPSTSGSTTRVIVGPVVKAYQHKMGYVFGDVQVVVTMRRNRIVSVKTPLVPPVGDTGGRGTQPITQSITQFAVPILKQEALHAQGTKIQTVSGATFTTDAFIRSLQAALVRAAQ